MLVYLVAHTIKVGLYLVVIIAQFETKQSLEWFLHEYGQSTLPTKAFVEH